MLVRMKVGISGSLNGVPYPAPGVEWDITDEAGAKLVAKGMATPVATHNRAETAVPPPDVEVRRGPGRPRKTPEETT